MTTRIVCIDELPWEIKREISWDQFCTFNRPSYKSGMAEGSSPFEQPEKT